MDKSSKNMEILSKTQQGNCNNNKPAKEKRRNNEKRKEKSRDAARTRRSRETEIFSELAQALPLRREDVDQLDKASVMRLSIAYLKVRDMLELIPKIKSSAKNFVPEDEEKDIKPLDIPKPIEAEKMIMQALDGFLLVLSADGDVTYISENISELLGIQQIDIMGQPIWEYTHQCDHDELREALNGKRGSSEIKIEANSGIQPPIHRDLFLRLKCTLTSRGRSVNIKSASYKVIHVSGHVAANSEGKRQLISVGRPLPHPSNIEIPLGSSTFLTKHSLDMKFSYVDDKMQTLLGYQPQHLMGKSLYECHHGADSESLMGSFKSLLSKGQIETCKYRFLARSGGYSWIVTQATMVYDKQKPQSVVCVNYVISGIENEDEIYSISQLEAKSSVQQKLQNNHQQQQSEVVKKEIIVIDKSEKPIKSVTDNSDNSINSNFKPILRVVPSRSKLQLPINRPRSVTAAIFAASQEIPQVVVTSPQQQQQQQQQQQKLKQQQLRAYSVTAKLFTSKAPNPQRPQTSTSKIFAPRTEDMNKGFLMFSEDESGLTMLKEEPDDLTHLAPTAGDACIPLEETTPFFTVFDDLIDNYCSLMPDDMNSLDSQGSSSKTNTDPFINYRDESSDTSGTPHLLSPGVSKSPEVSSLPSLCSPNGSLQDDDLAFMTMSMEDDIDLSMRAPYISMSEADDLPLLISEDLMWGAFPEGLSLHKDIKHMKEAIKNEANNNSSLAALLSTGNNNNNNINNNETSIQEQCQRQHHLQQNHQHTASITQQQHQQLNQNQLQEQQITDKNCRKMKLIDPTEVMGHVYNKSFPELQSWPINEFLQINSATNTISPKITLAKPTIPSPSISPASTASSSSSSSSSSLSSSSSSTSSAASLSGRTISTITTNNNNNINNNQMPTIIQQALKIKSERTINNHNNNNNKRSSANIVSVGDFSLTKRIKSEAPQQSSPQLLQQLMAPTSTPSRSRMKGGGNLNGKNDTRWPMDSNGNTNQTVNGLGGLPPPSSNSVLMNLLVSGCDTPLTIEPPDILMEDSLDLTPHRSMPASPIIDENGDICMMSISAKRAMTNVSNPMIGGSNLFLPSPPLLRPSSTKVMYQNANTMSPNLFTPADMEIWRSLQQSIQDKKSDYYRKDSLSLLEPSVLNEQDYELTEIINEFMLQGGGDLSKAFEGSSTPMA